MKRTTFLNLAFLLMAMLTFSGAFAQFVDPNFTAYNLAAPAPNNVDYLTLRTGGTTMGFYALPDPAYHPNYNAGGGWALTAGFVWNWTVPTNPGTPAVVTYPVAGPKPFNYVQITFPVTGNYVVNVTEQASPAMGGCTDATPTVMNVTVIAPPTAAATINPGVGWQAITANQSYQICAAQAAQTVTVTFNEAIANSLAAFSFAIAYKVENVDGAGAVVATPTANAIIQDFIPASKLKTGNLGALPGAAFATTTPTFTYTFNTPALAIVNFAGNPARTKYTYTLVRTGAIASTGFSSAISEKSDNIAGTTAYYPFTAGQDVVSFIINPLPSTGPIYHIANNFAY